MAFFDDLKKTLESFSTASEKVVKKSGSAVELRKLKMEQEALKKELNNCYAQIGRIVVDKMEGADVPAEMEMYVKQIADCKEAIAELEQLIACKRGQRICPVCGARADKAAVFCQKCGTRLPDIAQEEEMEETAETEAEASPETEEVPEKEPSEKADASEDTPV